MRAPLVAWVPGPSGQVDRLGRLHIATTGTRTQDGRGGDLTEVVGQAACSVAFSARKNATIRAQKKPTMSILADTDRWVYYQNGRLLDCSSVTSIQTSFLG